jgi:hypothetical protein
VVPDPVPMSAPEDHVLGRPFWLAMSCTTARALIVVVGRRAVMRQGRQAGSTLRPV